METKILKKVNLENIPSASGVEVINGIIYIIGDDSPYLYCLDHNLKLLEKIELFVSSDFASGRIPKNMKQDLECMTRIDIQGLPYIFIAGSGANENREVGYLIKLPTKYNKKHIVKAIDLHGLYSLLRSNNEISAVGVINLEAAACNKNHFYLFNRGSLETSNVVLEFNLEEFIVFLMENEELVPFPKLIHLHLPELRGMKAGFSGASCDGKYLYVTASVENTSNAIDDGEVIGSFLGIYEINETTYLRGDLPHSIGKQLSMNLLKDKEDVYLGKVESITILHKEEENVYSAVAVTDDDLGGSEILMLELRL
ncbi:MAG TPA: hypothetical protein VF691_19425 [Cytophagaceae bacterium]